MLIPLQIIHSERLVTNHSLLLRSPLIHIPLWRPLFHIDSLDVPSILQLLINPTQRYCLVQSPLFCSQLVELLSVHSRCCAILLLEQIWWQIEAAGAGLWLWRHGWSWKVQLRILLFGHPLAKEHWVDFRVYYQWYQGVGPVQHRSWKVLEILQFLHHEVILVLDRMAAIQNLFIHILIIY